MTDVIYCIPIAFCLLCFPLEKFSSLLPHSRCNSLHFSGFFAISISLRFCQFLVYQFVWFLTTGVLSHCYTFSLKATTLLQFSQHEKFIYSFVPSWPRLFIAFLLLLYTRNFAWCNSLSFLLCFCVWHLAYCFVIITVFFSHRFTSTLFIANFALVFPAWEDVYLLLPCGRCFLLLCCCRLSRRHLNIFVFPESEVLLFVCSLMVDVIHCIFITFYTTQFNTWYNSFSFSLCF